MDIQSHMTAVLASDSSHEPLVRRERIVWHSLFGDILIEIVGEDIYVDGNRVERSVGEKSQPGQRPLQP
jgi:hypothetical protein